MGDRPVIRRSSQLEATPTRRPGLAERRLLTPADSDLQNHVLIDAEQGAEVELHPVANSESFYVLEGELDVFGADWSDRLGPGDLCYFPPGMAHGVRVRRGPARFLVVFAPGGGGPRTEGTR